MPIKVKVGSKSYSVEASSLDEALDKAIEEARHDTENTI